MTVPSQTLTIIDPGIGVTPPVPNAPLYSGIAHGGTTAVNTLASISDPNNVRTEIGYGDLAEDILLALSERGGPINYVIHDSAQSVTLSAVALTPSAAGPAITVSGAPHSRFAIKLEIMLGGARGTATYRYALDAFESAYTPTWSQTRVSPSGGTFVIPGSGLTLNFPVGTYVLGETYTITTVPQEPGTVDLAAVAAILVARTDLNYPLWVVSGLQVDATTGAAIAAAFQAHMTTLTNSYRYMRGLIDVGSGDAKADVETAALTWEGVRVAASYGQTLRNSISPYEGWSMRKCAMVAGSGARAARIEISTDMARFAEGSDTGVLKIYFDGSVDTQLDTLKIGTMRQWPNGTGFYFTNAPLKSGFGSDFTDLQFGRVMDVACLTTYGAQQPYIAESLRTIPASQASEGRPAGSIDGRDAAAIEATVQNALKDNLLDPPNARGNPGHVSSVTYLVNRSTNLVTTKRLYTSVGLVPLGYSKEILTTLSYTLSA